jgi:DNA recombination protein RmuC
MTTMEWILVVAAFAIGALLAWLAARARRAQVEGAVIELRGQLERAGETERGLRAELSEEHERRVAAERDVENARAGLEEQRRAIEDVRRQMTETFESLAARSLRSSSEDFLRLAAERVAPLAESLSKLQQEIQSLESSRAEAYGKLTEQVAALAQSSQELRAETGSLVTSLRQPQIKGKWGELTLKRAVELAGMSEHVDFEQQTTIQTDEGRLRPDLVVHLPGGAQIVVDAKVPLHAFLKAVAIRTQEEYHAAMDDHARLVREHIAKLSSKAYWNQFDRAPDFVVLFLPGESFFSAALEKDHGLIEDAMSKRVVLASPTTLIVLLRSVAQVWRQEQVAENAQRISALGKDLHDRIRVFAEHLARVGSSLDAAARNYNNAVGSLEQRVLPGARRFRELGVQAAGEIEPLEPTTVAVRQLASAAAAGDEPES